MTCSFFMVELMPKNYALAAGLGNIGEPFSILFWSLAPLLLANPNNDSPDIKIRKNSMTEYYFGEAVTSRVPFLFQFVMVMVIVAGS
jgi:hypothetical protein